MRRGLAEVQGGLSEVRGGLAEVQSGLSEVRSSVAQLHAELRQEVTAIGGRLDVLDQRVRANGVMLEALRDEVHQLAEAHVMLAERVERYRQEHDVAHQEILVILRASYADLDRRVTRLESRIEERGRDV